MANPARSEDLRQRLLPPLLARIRPWLAPQALPVYLVGGAVRDTLMGWPCHDLDFVVPVDAVRLAFAVGNALGAPAYVLDEERDTGRVMLAAEGTTLDFARLRGPDLLADLRDRDFTVNAMAVPATDTNLAQLIDPCSGLADLQQRRLRLTHAGALAADPVRTLRAVRQALAFDFALDPQLEAGLPAAAPLLARVSAERIRDELLRLLAAAAPDRALQQLARLGLLAPVLPEVAALAGVAQSPPHREPALAHTISVLRWLVLIERLPAAAATPSRPAAGIAEAAAVLAPYREQLLAHLARPVDGLVGGRDLLRLGALLHDVGKSVTRSQDAGGRIRFLGHEQAGASLAAAALRRLAMSNRTVEYGAAVVRGHMRPLWLAQNQGGALSRRAVYRFFRELGRAGVDVALLALADHLATHDGPGQAATWSPLLGVVGGLLDHYFNRHSETISPPPLLDGRQLMVALELAPGPEVGRLLRLIEEAQAAGEVGTAAEALRLARRARAGPA